MIEKLTLKNLKHYKAKFLKLLRILLLIRDHIKEWFNMLNKLKIR